MWKSYRFTRFGERFLLSVHLLFLLDVKRVLIIYESSVQHLLHPVSVREVEKGKQSSAAGEGSREEMEGERGRGRDCEGAGRNKGPEINGY